MTMKTKKTLQHITAVAVVLLTLTLMFSAPVSADDYVAYIGEVGYSDMTTALSALQNGETLKLVTGSFEAFEINVPNVIITGYDDSTEITVASTTDTAFIGVCKDGVTVKGLKFIIPETVLGSKTWLTSVVGFASSQYNYGGVEPIGWNVIDCDFVQKGNNLGIAVFNCDNFTVDGCTFTNFGTGIVAMNDGSPLETVEITDNTFTRVNEPVFLYWGQPSETSSLAITGNTFVSAKDADAEIKLSIDDYAFRENGAYGIGNIDLSGNNFNAPTVVEIVDVSASVEADVEEDFEGQNNVVIEKKYEGVSARIGDTFFTTLAEAVEAAEAGETVTLLKDVSLTDQLTVDKSIIFDGNGKSLTRPTSGKIIYLMNTTEDVTLKVTLQNFKEISGGLYAVYLGSKTDLIIKDSTLNAYGAIYLSTYGDNNGSNSKVTILNSELIGVNSYPSGTSSDFGTIVIQANDTVVDVQNSKLVAKVTGTANQSILRFGSDSGTSHFENAKVTIGGNSVLEVINANFMSVGTGTPFTGISQQIIGAGVTANFNPSAYIAPGMEVVQPGDKYLVQKYVDRSSSSSSSSTTEPEEPEQPEEPVVEPETPAAPGEVASSTEVTDGGDVTFETPAGEDGTAPAAADDEVKGVVLPTGTEGTVEFVPVSETPAPAGQEENTKRVFEINVPSYKKGEASVIKFQMTVAEIEADGKTAADVALWHYDEETGEWTKLVTSFVIKDGIVYFEAITNDFSPFAIIYEDEPAGDLPTDTPETPEQPEEPASPAPVLAVLAALGAAVVLRRK